MARIPKSRDVDTALNELNRRLKASLDEIHQQVAEVMRKGNYNKAEELMLSGKQLQAFQLNINTLKREWNGLKGGNKANKQVNRITPLWLYYQPILQALVDLGGEATRIEIEPKVESLMNPAFLPGDTDKMRQGRFRWQLMIRRARKQLIKEGWLESGNSKHWRVTAQGEKAAKAERKGNAG